MQLKYFQLLLGSKEYRPLLQQGIYLAERRCDDSQVLLFAVEHYYAEVFFDPYTDDINGSRCFESTDELAPYLEQIDLAALLSANPGC